MCVCVFRFVWNHFNHNTIRHNITIWWLSEAGQINIWSFPLNYLFLCPFFFRCCLFFFTTHSHHVNNGIMIYSSKKKQNVGQISEFFFFFFWKSGIYFLNQNPKHQWNVRACVRVCLCVRTNWRRDTWMTLYQIRWTEKGKISNINFECLLFYCQRFSFKHIVA